MNIIDKYKFESKLLDLTEYITDTPTPSWTAERPLVNDCCTICTLPNMIFCMKYYSTLIV